MTLHSYKYLFYAKFSLNEKLEKELNLYMVFDTNLSRNFVFRIVTVRWFTA